MNDDTTVNRATMSGLAARILDPHLRGTLRRHGLLDLPETRELLRARWVRGFTLGAAPSQDKLRALRTAAIRACAASEGYDRNPT